MIEATSANSSTSSKNVYLTNFTDKDGAGKKRDKSMNKDKSVVDYTQDIKGKQNANRAEATIQNKITKSNVKYLLPIQVMSQPKKKGDTQNLKTDFEPIIIEEVYYSAESKEKMQSDKAKKKSRRS